MSRRYQRTTLRRSLDIENPTLEIRSQDRVSRSVHQRQESSAVGLSTYVSRDPEPRQVVLESGALLRIKMVSRKFLAFQTF